VYEVGGLPSELGASELPFEYASPMELLRARAILRPQHEALVWRPFEGPRAVWTYSELVSDVESFADELEDLGVTSGDFVCVHATNCPEFVVAWFALNELGAVLVSTNARSTPSELAYYIERSNCRLVISQRCFAETVSEALAAVAREVPALWIDGPEAGPGRVLFHSQKSRPKGPARFPDPFAVAGIQFTSGTTSRPKGVVWTNANYLWGARVSANHEGLTADDRYLVHLPLFHTNSQIYSVMASLWVGATVILLPRFSVRRFWAIAVEERATWSSMIPFSVKALRDEPVPEHSFRSWGNGIHVPRWDDYFKVTTVAWWGMTETISHPIVSDPNVPARPMSMGMPAPEYRVRVVDESGHTVAEGDGLLEVLGTPGLSLMLGYLDDPSATADAYTPDGWLKTGDTVRLHADGWLSFLEREKDMLKVGGENVAALEIELVIGRVEGVREVAVVAKADHMLEQVPVAFVIADQNANAEALSAAIIDQCQVSLASFKQPREVRLVPELPRSTLEKVAKAVLRQWAESPANKAQ
jgi:crotonobetaine/carnitine-CoA ligase